MIIVSVYILEQCFDVSQNYVAKYIMRHPINHEGVTCKFESSFIGLVHKELGYRFRVRALRF
jgi:hypothetical protein